MRSPTDDNGISTILARVEERSAWLEGLSQSILTEKIQDFRDKLLFSWIYHDNALEGIVLTFAELTAAIEHHEVSDISLIPSVDEIKAHQEAIGLVYELADKKKGGVTLDLIKRIYAALSPGVNDVKLVRYRKETPLHRLYFHEISPPEKISYRMRRLVEWLASPQAKSMHPIKLASKTHFKLMHIYPFPKSSGKLARLVMNLILLKSGYEPSIIHATDRQRYYDALRAPHGGLTRLVCESLLNSVEGAIKVLEEEAMPGGLKGMGSSIRGWIDIDE